MLLHGGSYEGVTCVMALFSVKGLNCGEVGFTDPRDCRDSRDQDFTFVVFTLLITLFIYELQLCQDCGSIITPHDNLLFPIVGVKSLFIQRVQPVRSIE